MLASTVSVLEAYKGLRSSYGKSSNARCCVVGDKIQEIEGIFRSLWLHTWFWHLTTRSLRPLAVG